MLYNRQVKQHLQSLVLESVIYCEAANSELCCTVEMFRSALTSLESTHILIYPPPNTLTCIQHETLTKSVCCRFIQPCIRMDTAFGSMTVSFAKDIKFQLFVRMFLFILIWCLLASVCDLPTDPPAHHFFITQTQHIASQPMSRFAHTWKTFIQTNWCN